MKAPFTPAGEPTAEFIGLLLLGRERGWLGPDDLMPVLEGVELRPELISALVGRIVAEGVDWRDPGELLSDEALDKLASDELLAKGLDATELGADGSLARRQLHDFSPEGGLAAGLGDQVVRTCPDMIVLDSLGGLRVSGDTAACPASRELGQDLPTSPLPAISPLGAIATGATGGEEAEAEDADAWRAERAAGEAAPSVALTNAASGWPPRHNFLRKRARGAHRGAKRVTVAGLSLDLGVAGTSISDSVRAYLKEIGRLRLLTAEQEVALAHCMKVGAEAAARLETLDALEALDARRAPTAGGHKRVAAERKALEKQREQDERLRAEGALARQVLVEANLRLVVSVAKWYRNRGLSFLDMIQEGNLGLMRAVERFDYTKGFKFSTYATWWIRQAINRAIADQARTIRIPIHTLDSINAVLMAQRTLLQESGREPTIDEVAQRAQLTCERVREILRISQDTVSLEQPIGDDEFSLSDTIEDDSALSPAEAAAHAMLAQAVREVLADLPEREREVVRLRFGLDDGKARTLEEVGKEFGVTRERVRQIESKTLAKLRQPVHSGQLRDYLVN